MVSVRRAMWVLGVAGCASAPAPPTPAPAAAPRPAPAPAPPTSAYPIPGGSPGNVTVRYPRGGGGIAHYTFARRDSVIITMPSADSQFQVFGRTAFVTITWTAVDSGARLTATVDSLVADSGLADFGVFLDSARAARWTAFRRPTGRLIGLSGGSPSLVGDQIRDQLQLLFPVLPPEGARPGATWTDSTVRAARVGAFEAMETAKIESRAEPATSGALPLIVVRDRTATGQGTQFGQPITLKATGTDTLTYQLTPDGQVLSVAGVRLTDLVVTLPDVGQSVPAHERSSLRMTVLR